MSRRRHVKPVRQTAVFVGFPKLIEGEDYTAIVALLFALTLGLLIFTFPSAIFAGFSFDCFLLVVWQLYSGIALNTIGRERKLMAKYTKEREPSVFYLNLGIWLLIGLVTLVIFLNIYFAPRQLFTL